MLTGEPGAGKSAFAAQLTERRRDVAAFHFCIDGRIATVTPGAVLRSIAAQLLKKLPGYAEALVESIKPHRWRFTSTSASSGSIRADGLPAW